MLLLIYSLISKERRIVCLNIFLNFKREKAPSKPYSGFFMGDPEKWGKSALIDKFVESCTGVCPGHSLTQSHAKLM